MTEMFDDPLGHPDWWDDELRLDQDEALDRLSRPLDGSHHSPRTIAHLEAGRVLRQLRRSGNDARVADVHEQLVSAVQARLLHTHRLPVRFAEALANSAIDDLSL